ncbi:DJ-1/PfpI family protein [Trichoderma chlorosporum]
MAPKILVVLTNVGKIEASGQSIGWYLPEFAHPYEILSQKAELITASPKGGLAPLDPSSIEAFKTDKSCQTFFNDQKDLWEKTLPLHQLLGRASEFEAIFFPGVMAQCKHLLKGREATGISNEEEEYPAVMPFSLQDVIEESGAEYILAPEKLEENIVVDGQIITGQNLNSAIGVANAIATAIGLF